MPFSACTRAAVAKTILTLTTTATVGVMALSACGSSHPSAVAALYQASVTTTAVSAPTTTPSPASQAPIPTATTATTPTSAPTSAATATRPAGLAVTTTSTPSGARPTADAAKIVQTAWLAPSQLPGAAILTWTTSGTQQVDTEPARIDGPRYAPWCRGLPPPIGQQVLRFAGVGSTSARQWLFIYASPQAAQKAYQDVVASELNCQDQSRGEQTQFGAPADASITRTATIIDGSSWSRHWTGVETPAGGTSPGKQANHEYVVQRGPVVSVVDYDEGPTSSVPTSSAPTRPYDTTGDIAVIHAMAASLCTYGGPCS